jgi:uncharacterized protein HemY
VAESRAQEWNKALKKALASNKDTERPSTSYALTQALAAAKRQKFDTAKSTVARVRQGKANEESVRQVADALGIPREAFPAVTRGEILRRLQVVEDRQLEGIRKFDAFVQATTERLGALEAARAQQAPPSVRRSSPKRGQ